jgi:hypothetical protein
MPLDLLARLDPLRRIRCPFCFARFAAYELHLRCDSPVCETDFSKQIDDPILSRVFQSPIRSSWWTDPPHDENRGLRRYLDLILMPGSLTCPFCERPTDRHLCPRCHQWLPDDAITGTSGHITIFGPQSVGKTTYLTVLLEEMGERVGPSQGWILEPLTDDVRDRFKHEYRDVTYGSGGIGVGQDSNGDFSRHPHQPTVNLKLDRRVLQPFIFKLKRRDAKGHPHLLSFSDMAGEDWEMDVQTLRREAGHLIRDSRGLLFLIDPLRLPQVAHDPRLQLTEKERHVPPAEYKDDISKLSAFFPRTPSKVPLAICLNKIDRWGPLLAEGTTLHDVARSVPLGPADRRLDQIVHEEVKSALRHWDQLSFLEHLAIDFPNHRFFACSALGDAAQEREDVPQPLPTPLLVDRPILWLLEQQKLIASRG